MTTQATALPSWGNYMVETPWGSKQYHTVPHHDLEVHQLTDSCHCKPVEDDECPGMWCHNAFDGREEYERGRKLH